MKTCFLLSLCLWMFVNVLPGVEIPKLIQETQRMEQTSSRLSIVWWIPTAFWEETLKQSPELNDEQRAKFLSVLDAYSVFSVVVMDTGVFGGMTPKTREEIVANTRLDVDSVTVAPIATEALSADAKNFFAMMKPLLAQMMGQLGQGMEFIVYPNRNEGRRMIEPMKTGGFTYSAFGKSYEWKLPLPSLLPPMADAETGELFPGDFRFNPYTGRALVAPKPAVQ